MRGSHTEPLPPSAGRRQGLVSLEDSQDPSALAWPAGSTNDSETELILPFIGAPSAVSQPFRSVV